MLLYYRYPILHSKSILPINHLIPVEGMRATGKTTMLYKYKLGEIVTTIPTEGITLLAIFLIHVLH